MKPTSLTTAILTIFCIAVLAVGASFAAPINVAVNETLDIALPSNPSTGYSWTVEYDDDYLELVNQSYIPREVGPGIVGSGGDETFTFRAVEAGETNIDFTYGGRGDIINTTTYSVVITGLTPANNTTNTTNTTNVTPADDTQTIPMQPTGVPLVVLVMGALAVAAGVAASKR